VVVGVLALGARAFSQPVDDHLACYRITDTAAARKFTVTVANAATTVTCTVKTPARLGCLASSASAVDPSPSGDPVPSGALGHMLCYKMKCPKPFPAATEFADELGGRRVVRFLRDGTLLCAPASATPTPVPITTTTTVPAAACHFDDDMRRCEGSCGNGGRCSAVVSGGACECRATACGDADAPACNGYCQRDEACIYAVTGCKCVGIP
jgi:hypothetical protein